MCLEKNDGEGKLLRMHGDELCCGGGTFSRGRGDKGSGWCLMEFHVYFAVHRGEVWVLFAVRTIQTIPRL